MDRVTSTHGGTSPDLGAMAASQSSEPNQVRTVNLALQGGGAHGAFTWGVLDRLLESDGLSFEGISATSAGAMNAVVMAYGLLEGGRDGARRGLADFWRRVSHLSASSWLQPTPFDRLTHNHSMDHSPAFMMFDLMTRVLSPYQFNPTGYNPLAKLVAGCVDFDRLRESNSVKLFLCATNVRSGKVKIFRNDEISLDSVLASACLPFLYPAVEIDGEAYWDGGYMGNPAIFPLIYDCASPDVLIVHINPIMRHRVPQSAAAIANRINEISFNSSLMREMRAIAFITRLIDEGKITDPSLRRMLIHGISADTFMRELSVSSKLNADWEFLTHLRDVGREAASDWLDRSLDKVGTESSICLRDIYL